MTSIMIIKCLNQPYIHLLWLHHHNPAPVNYSKIIEDIPHIQLQHHQSYKFLTNDTFTIMHSEGIWVNAQHYGNTLRLKQNKIGWAVCLGTQPKQEGRAMICTGCKSARATAYPLWQVSGSSKRDSNKYTDSKTHRVK